MKEEKNKKLLKYVMFILLILGLGVISHFVYNNYIVDNNEKKNNDDSNVDDDNNTIVIPQAILEKIVKDDGLTFLDGKTSISDITNQDKLKYIYEQYFDSHPAEVPSTSFDAYFATTTLAYLGLIHEDIMCNCGLMAHFYDKSTGIYTKNTLDAHGKYTIVDIYRKTVSYVPAKDNYVIGIQYLWTEMSDDIDTANVYTTYKLSNIVLTKKATDDDPYPNFSEEEVATFMEDNYDELKDQLETYYYTFQIVNNKIRLTDFRVE